MSRFSPSQTLKSGFNDVKGTGTYLRRALVILQFVISQTLLIGLLVIQSQLSYFINADMGFQKEGIVTINLPQDKIDKGTTLKNELAKIPGISKVSLASAAASSENIWMTGFRFEGAEPDAHHIAEVKMADDDYLDLYSFKLLAGRNYFERDTLAELVVNRAMIEEMGYTDPEEAIGSGVSFGRDDAPNSIVGVIENFYTSSLYAEVGPTVIQTNSQAYSMANVKLDLLQMSDAMENMESTWTSIFPDDEYNYTFMDDQIRQYYEREQQLSEIIMWFTIVALFIGAMGLYGLVTYVVNQRMKELGIRKVMGASFAQLFNVISKEFAILVVVAFAMAGPLAWYFGNSWLSDYDNRIEIGPMIFILAFLASGIVAFLAILHKSLNATRVNPVETLRNE